MCASSLKQRMTRATVGGTSREGSQCRCIASGEKTSSRADRPLALPERSEGRDEEASPGSVVSVDHVCHSGSARPCVANPRPSPYLSTEH